MRLQEIQSRLEKLNHNSAIKRYEAKMEFEAHAEADVDFLIERLERYETALKEIEPLCYVHDVYSINKIAEEALKENTTPKAE